MSSTNQKPTSSNIPTGAGIDTQPSHNNDNKIQAETNGYTANEITNMIQVGIDAVGRNQQIAAETQSKVLNKILLFGGLVSTFLFIILMYLLYDDQYDLVTKFLSHLGVLVVGVFGGSKLTKGN